MVFLLEWVSERRLNVTPHEVLHHKYRATRRHWPHVRHNRGQAGRNGSGRLRAM
jgi:hypothetical protein